MTVETDRTIWMRRRLVVINEKIATIKHWGAILTALEEERRGILREMSRDGENGDK